MRDKVIAYFRRLHFPVMLMLTAFPPALLVACMSFHASEHAFSLCALCALSVPLCLVLPGKKRLIAAAMISAALLALSARLGASVMLSVICCLTLFGALRISHNTLHTIAPVFYLCGIVSHAVTQFLLRSSLVGAGLYSFLLAPLTAFTLLYLALLLLTFNGVSLDNASLGRHSLPASVRRINVLMTLGFLALALLLACTPAIVSSVVSLWHTLLDALSRLDDLLMRLLPVGEDLSGAGMPAPMQIPSGMIPVSEPSLFAVILERIATVLTTIVVIAGSILLVWQICRLLRKLLRHVIRRLHSYVLIVSDDYIDEVSDTREEEGEHSASRRARILRRASVYDQTPGGMIRARYAQLLRKHPQWHASSTARENLPQQPAALYERARYSPHPITKEDADRFSADTRRM